MAGGGPKKLQKTHSETPDLENRLVHHGRLNSFCEELLLKKDLTQLGSHTVNWRKNDTMER